MRDGSGGEDHYQENNFTCGGGGGEGGGSGKVYNMSQLPLCILLVHGEDLTYSLQLDLILISKHIESIHQCKVYKKVYTRKCYIMNHLKDFHER